MYIATHNMFFVIALYYCDAGNLDTEFCILCLVRDQLNAVSLELV